MNKFDISSTLFCIVIIAVLMSGYLMPDIEPRDIRAAEFEPAPQAVHLGE